MTRKIKTTKTAEQRRAEADALQASIAEQVEQLRHSAAWERFLDYAQHFHRYSINNLMLIIDQYPTATQVAGFRKWQTLGRQVRKGEHSLKIFGYSTKTINADDTTKDTTAKETATDDTGDDADRVRVSYPVLSVFDIAQTDPVDGVDDLTQDRTLAQHLTGDDPHDILPAVADWLTTQGWTFTREPIPGDTNGYTATDGTQRVVIDSTLSPAQAAKTALHEAAHVILHADDDHADYIEHRGLKETEAESVAYIVGGILGLDTTAYTIGYITHWSNADTDLIKATAERVLKAAHILTDNLTAVTTVAAA